jgi:UDP-3-O-[3-hydroxymyristoyl] glucosamine N-acyltransferase
MSVTLGDIARLLGAAIPDDSGKLVIDGAASLARAGSGDISFISNSRYARQLETTRASAVLVPPGTPVPSTAQALEVADPYVAFVRVLSLFDTRTSAVVASGIHDSAVIHPGAVLAEGVSAGPCAVINDGVIIGSGTTIGPGAVVLANTKIGSDCIIYPNVTIMDNCVLGDRVILHSGVVIGADGFGFAPHGGSYVKIPQIGRVIIEDDVELGACTCVDRAVFDDTVICRGAKLDNLIQVAHNARVGADTVIAAQAGISGTTEIGAGVRIGGQAGFAGHLTVGDGANVGAQAGVTKSVPPGETVSDYPAKPHAQALRIEASLRRLPELLKTVKALEQRLAELEAQDKRTE